MALRAYIEAALVARVKTALAAYMNNTADADLQAGYVGLRADEGDPPAMSGDWFAAVHSVTSRKLNRLPGQPYRQEQWSAAVTITVRSSYAPDRKIAGTSSSPQELLRDMAALLANYFDSNAQVVRKQISDAFEAATSTNGLLTPFQVEMPQPDHKAQPLNWIKAKASKQTSQKNLLSATIRLVDALGIQPGGGQNYE